jgi:hypothetical protein
MACMTLFAPSMAMATTQFTRTILCEVSAPCQFELTTNRHPLRLSWVVVTDDNGSQHLRMAWAAPDNG